MSFKHSCTNVPYKIIFKNLKLLGFLPEALFGSIQYNGTNIFDK